jgi:hypothetical protein
MTEIETSHSDSSPKISARVEPDDKILPETRWVAILIIPFLLTAWVILYVFPQETESLFAWPVNPTLSARLMGAGYLAGAYFFLRVAVARKWHTVEHGFLPVAVFAAWMAVTTLLHWSRFSHGHISFITWAGIYAITPLLVFIIWFRNRTANSGADQEQGARVRDWMRWTMGILGTGMLLFAVAFYINPDWMIAIWPWSLTALTARALLGFFLIPAGTFILLALDPRWSAHRVVIQGQIVGMALIMIASALSWSDFFPSNPAAWLFVGSGLLVLLALFEYYRIMEEQADQE